MALKKTSEVIVISSSVTESAPNTFTQAQVDLQLNPLDQEVFVVTAIDLNLTPPDAIAGVDTASLGSLSTTSRTSIGNISISNTMAEARDDIRAAGFVDGGVGFHRNSGETPHAQLDYIGIIATNDFFLQVEGLANGVAKTLLSRVWGYRAKADAATYAALTQSELLSA